MNYKVKVGDHVIHDGKEMYVENVIEQGMDDKYKDGKIVKKGIKAYICVCPIMPDNGQVLYRSPRCIGNDWENIEE